MQLKNKNSDIFRLSKKYLGKGFTITVSQQPNRADYESNPDCQCKVFKYNHDDLFKDQQHRFLKGGSAFYSWKKYGTYTKTSGYPTWAASFVTEHLTETTKHEPNTLVELNQKIEDLSSEILRLERKYDSKAHLSGFIIIACIAIALYLIQTQ